MAFRTAMLMAMFGLACLTRLDAFYRKPRDFHLNLVPDAMWAPTERLAEHMGLVVEVHTFSTPDGYVLTVHRIPRAQQSSADSKPPHRTPVLCTAGLGANSEMWLLRRDPNLVISLVDAGFDVWLGNYRGSFYGRRHATLRPSMKEFWDFSWHENGLIDQRATIDYILRTTGRSKLITIGHSMANTAQAVLMSEKPDYAREKVLCSVFLAPPMYFANPGGLIQLLRTFFYVLPQLKEATGSHVVNDKMPLMEQSMITYCFSNSNPNFSFLCRIGVSLILGKPRKNLSNAHALSILAHFPAGASIRQVLHFAQSLASGEFQKYDYGSAKNLKLYGSLSPPSYNLSAIDIPVHVFYGTTDGLVSAADARKFIENCPAVEEVFKVPYNHVDYAIDDTVTEKVSKPLINLLAKYI